MSVERTQVAIVGGGPVGFGLAIDLGQRGIRTTILERAETLHAIPKGQNLTQRSGEHFKAWGVFDEVAAAVRIPTDYGTDGITTYGAILSPYTFRWLSRTDVSEYYAAPNQRLPQYDVERVLRARAANLESIDVRLGANVTALASVRGGATVTFTDADGARSRIEADYIVGCDGSRSIVRDAAGIDQTFGSHRRRMVLVVFRSTALHRLMERHPGVSFYKVLHPDHEGYWRFLGRVDLGTTWFFHCPVGTEDTEDTVDVPGLLAATVGEPFDLEVDYLGFWDLRFATADSYRAGNVFIAGDAAHSHPPYGGFGVNTGFEDARNLAWKLAARLSGWGSESLLDSYGEERRPVFASTARDFIERMIEQDRAFVTAYDPDTDRAAFEAEWNRRATAAPSDVAAFVPHYGGSPVVVDGDGETGAVAPHEYRAAAGYHLAPLGGVHERLGSSFTCIAIGAAAAAAADAFAAAAVSAGIPLKVCPLPDDARTAPWEARCILVRPDHFVAWAGGCSPGRAAGILARSVGR